MLLKSKVVSIILTVLIVASVATGCNRGAARGVSGDSRNISVLNYADNTNPNTLATFEWTWGTFRAANPDVTLMIEDLFNEPFHNKTEAYSASGNLPDVLYVWPSGRSTSLHQNRQLKDLGPLVTRDGLRSVYSPAALDPSQQASGYLAMIPLTMTATHAFFVNLEVLNAVNLQPAKTYDELRAQVPILRAAGYETVIMPNKDTWVMQSCLFSMIAGRFGGPGWHDKILSGQAKFTDPDFVNALDFIRRLYADNVLAPASLGLDYGAGPGQFATNRGAYYIDGDWRTGAFITDSSTGEALIPVSRQNNFLVTVFPDIAGAKINKSNSTVLGVGWAISAAVPTGSPREDAAWRLVKWLTGREVLTRGIRDGAYSSTSRTDIDVSALPLEPLQKTAANLSSEYTSATVVIDAVFHSDIFNVVNDGLREIALGRKTPQQVATEIQRAFDRWKARN